VPPTHFEHFEPGQTFEFGGHTITAEEIVEFATRFDPQDFHVDEQAALTGPFGGLIASGWHTSAIFMRMYVDALLKDAVSMGSPGVEEIRWLVPVRPGDTLRGRATILEATPSAKRADRGTIRSQLELLNQRDEVVMTMVARGLFGRLEPAGPG
jgi:acyl dehydratase